MSPRWLCLVLILPVVLATLRGKMHKNKAIASLQIEDEVRPWSVVSLDDLITASQLDPDVVLALKNAGATFLRISDYVALRKTNKDAVAAKASKSVRIGVVDPTVQPPVDPYAGFAGNVFTKVKPVLPFDCMNSGYAMQLDDTHYPMEELDSLFGLTYFRVAYRNWYNDENSAHTEDFVTRALMCAQSQDTDFHVTHFVKPFIKSGLTRHATLATYANLGDFTTWQSGAGLTNIKDVDKADKGITTWEIATLYHLAVAGADLSRVYFVFGAYNLNWNFESAKRDNTPNWITATAELTAHDTELDTKTYTAGSWVDKNAINPTKTTTTRIWIWQNKPQPSCQQGTIPYIWRGEETTALPDIL